MGGALEPKFRALNCLAGNTPLLGVEFLYQKHQRVINAKCEQLNLTGSIKDRIALHMLRKAYSNEQLHPGDTIAEASKGNTGIAFAALGWCSPISASMVPCSREARKDIHAGLDESRTSRADSQFQS